MPTNRTPINRPPRGTIPPEAIPLFRELHSIECTCEDGANILHPCAGCDRWWHLQGKLHELLRMPPWQWPAVIPPTQASVDAPGSGGARWHPQAQKLYRQLMKLAGIEENV